MSTSTKTFTAYRTDSDWVQITITGRDARAFLQAQTTWHMDNLLPGEGHWCASVDRQGRMKGFFWLMNQSESSDDSPAYALFIERSQTESLIAHLRKFHILEQLTIETDESGSEKVLCIYGQSVSELPGIENASFFDFNWLGLPGVFVFFSTSEDRLAYTNKLEQAGISGLTPEAMTLLRIQWGIPVFGIDYDEQTLLPETGLHQLAVSYDKGCFQGQEVLARVKTYGALQRALCGLILSGRVDLSPVDSDILNQDGQRVGQLKSHGYDATSDQTIAMAYLNQASRIPGQSFMFRYGHSPETIETRVVMLPMATFTQSSLSKPPQINPEDAQKLLADALDAFRLEKDEQAIDLLNQAITIDPALTDAYEALGVILGRHDRVDEAIAMMDQLLVIDPEHVLAHTNLSVFWLKKGDKEKAEEEKAKATIAGMRKKAKESGFDFAKLEAERQAREAAKRQALEDRIVMFIDALQYSPEDPLGNFGLGSAYLELLQYDQAIQPLERVITAQPKHTVAYLSLGKALEGVGGESNINKAVQIYQQGIEVAAKRGDMQPLTEMQQRLDKLKNASTISG